MDEDAKKTALRITPYGMYVLATKSKAAMMWVPLR